MFIVKDFVWEADSLKTWHLIVVFIANLLSACAVNPVTGEQDFVLMSEAEEVQKGQQAYRQVLNEFRVYPDDALQAYVQHVGEQVAKVSHRGHLQFTFTIIDSPDINAFALPGGFIFIHRGLMAYLNSEAELAAVLAHEVGHVTARHSVRQQGVSTVTSLGSAILKGVLRSQGVPSVVGDLSDMAGMAFIRGYGREHELESDRLGAEYLAKAGFEPNAMIDVIGVLKDQEVFASSRAVAEGRQINSSYHGLFASHPRNDTRLQELVAQANVWQQGQGSTGTFKYLENIRGMTFGYSAVDGVHRGDRFYHQELGVTFEVPSGWFLQNTSKALVMFDQGRTNILTVTLEQKPPNTTPKHFLRQLLQGRPLSEEKVLSNYGVKGYSGVLAGKKLKRVGVAFEGQKAFIWVGEVKYPQGFDFADEIFIKTMDSFRGLKQGESKLAASQKISLVKANRGAGYTSMAERSVIAEFALEQLRLLNGHYPDGEPQPGQWLKTIK